ncbi:hypothetical protein EVAR_21403_1 [Eumeta japonica]|uniref:Uncharacterized protein n=1 Tax=Eumeta variegata TaxID=151549 RepID=A0A4C1VFJ0_EUMVA|nr:hypothetical protein EVAR_21403_1 [Eumeta japonica]
MRNPIIIGFFYTSRQEALSSTVTEASMGVIGILGSGSAGPGGAEASSAASVDNGALQEALEQAEERAPPPAHALKHELHHTQSGVYDAQGYTVRGAGAGAPDGGAGALYPALCVGGAALAAAAAVALAVARRRTRAPLAQGFVQVIRSCRSRAAVANRPRGRPRRSRTANTKERYELWRASRVMPITPTDLTLTSAAQNSATPEESPTRHCPFKNTGSTLEYLNIVFGGDTAVVRAFRSWVIRDLLWSQVRDGGLIASCPGVFSSGIVRVFHRRAREFCTRPPRRWKALASQIKNSSGHFTNICDTIYKKLRYPILYFKESVD